MTALLLFRRVLDYQADLDAQVAKEMAWREDDQEYIRKRDALFARNLQVLRNDQLTQHAFVPPIYVTTGIL